MRPGLSLYGLAPQYDPHSRPRAANSHRCAPSPSTGAQLEIKSRRCAIRSRWHGGGLQRHIRATEPMRLALIAVGYGDGLDRRLGNRFSLLVRGQRAPIVGRISMDQTVLDVTGISGGRQATKWSSSAVRANEAHHCLSTMQEAIRNDSVGNFHPHQRTRLAPRDDARNIAGVPVATHQRLRLRLLSFSSAAATSRIRSSRPCPSPNSKACGKARARTNPVDRTCESPRRGACQKPPAIDQRAAPAWETRCKPVPLGLRRGVHKDMKASWVAGQRTGRSPAHQHAFASLRLVFYLLSDQRKHAL